MWGRIVLSGIIASGVTLVRAQGGDNYGPCPRLPTGFPPLPTPLPEKVLMALQSVDALFSGVVRDNNISGLVATVVYDQQPLWTMGYGSANPWATPAAGPPTGKHLLRIASITKTFTSMLAYVYRDAGVVDLDDDVRKHVPDFGILHPYSTQNVTTMRQLASHTSGLPRDLGYPCGFDPSCSDADVYAMLRKTYRVLPQFSRFHYSNVGFGLLGRALEMAAGPQQRYEDLVAERLLQPLGMNATFDVSPATLSRMAVGRNSDGTRATVSALGWEAPAGGLLASADDMTQWLKFHFRSDAPASKDQPVDGSTVTEALASQTVLRDGSSAVGLPWEYKYSGGFWTKSKQGELPGFRSSVTLISELKLGIFVSALQSDVSEDSVWAIPAIDLLSPAVLEILNERQPTYTLPEHYKQFVGSYHFNSSIFVGPSGVLEGIIFGQHLNFTEVMDTSVNPPVPVGIGLRAEPIGPGSNPGCRWLDDGSDLEIIYFDGLKGPGDFTTLSSGFRFMGSAAERL